MKRRASLLGLCGLAALIALAKPAYAVLTSDNTNIGDDPAYGSGYSAFWRSGADYSLLTNGTDTFVNAPGSNGTIHFRSNNKGFSGSADTATLDSSGNLTVAQLFFAQAVSANSALNNAISGVFNSSDSGYYGVYGSSTSPNGAGVYGTTNQAYPAAGVSGVSTASSNAIGVHGQVSTTGVGVEGETVNGEAVAGVATGDTAMGVYGQHSGSGVGYGVYGTTAGIGGYAVYGLSSASNGYGGYFAQTGLGNNAGSYGVYATSSNLTGTGVYATVTGSNNGGWALQAINTNAATALNADGAIYAKSTHAPAMYADSTSGPALYAETRGTTGTPYGIYINGGNSNMWAIFANMGNIHIAGSVAEKSGGGQWTGTSDVRTKRDISKYTSGLSDIERINPIRFKYNGLGGTTNDGRGFVGVAAQEVAQVAPEMVMTRKASLRSGEAPTDIEMVDPSAFTYMLINSVKELSAQVKSLQAEIKSLRKR
jgi:hypothetical protein